MRKNIFTIIICVFLFATIGVLSYNIMSLNNKYSSLQTSSQIDNTPQNYILNEINESNEFYSAYNSNINEIKENLIVLQNEFNNIPSYSDDINELKRQIKDLKEQDDNNYSEKIDNLEEQINVLSNKIDTLQTKKKSEVSIIGKWETTVDDVSYRTSGYSTEKIEQTYNTIYDFRDNGDIYVNNVKIGTFSNSNVYLKDSNDTNYRVAHYYFFNNTLYVNFFDSEKNITCSTNLFECKKVN